MQLWFDEMDDHVFKKDSLQEEMAFIHVLLGIPFLAVYVIPDHKLLVVNFTEESHRIATSLKNVKIIPDEHTEYPRHNLYLGGPLEPLSSKNAVEAESVLYDFAFEVHSPDYVSLYMDTERGPAIFVPLFFVSEPLDVPGKKRRIKSKEEPKHVVRALSKWDNLSL